MKTQIDFLNNINNNRINNAIQILKITIKIYSNFTKLKFIILLTTNKRRHSIIKNNINNSRIFIMKISNNSKKIIKNHFQIGLKKLS